MLQLGICIAYFRKPIFPIAYQPSNIGHQTFNHDYHVVHTETKSPKIEQIRCNRRALATGLRGGRWRAKGEYMSAYLGAMTDTVLLHRCRRRKQRVTLAFALCRLSCC
jgi:hypothetical protein